MKALKQLKNDFGFVQDYGYEYGYDLKHYVYPSVVFIKNNKKVHNHNLQKQCQKIIY